MMMLALAMFTSVPSIAGIDTQSISITVPTYPIRRDLTSLATLSSIPEGTYTSVSVTLDQTQDGDLLLHSSGDALTLNFSPDSDPKILRRLDVVQQLQKIGVRLAPVQGPRKLRISLRGDPSTPAHEIVSTLDVTTGWYHWVGRSDAEVVVGSLFDLQTSDIDQPYSLKDFKLTVEGTSTDHTTWAAAVSAFEQSKVSAFDETKPNRRTVTLTATDGTGRLYTLADAIVYRQIPTLSENCVGVFLTKRSGQQPHLDIRESYRFYRAIGPLDRLGVAASIDTYDPRKAEEEKEKQEKKKKVENKLEEQNELKSCLEALGGADKFEYRLRLSLTPDGEDDADKTRFVPSPWSSTLTAGSTGTEPDAGLARLGLRAAYETLRKALSEEERKVYPPMDEGEARTYTVYIGVELRESAEPANRMVIQHNRPLVVRVDPHPWLSVEIVHQPGQAGLATVSCRDIVPAVAGSEEDRDVAECLANPGRMVITPVASTAPVGGRVVWSPFYDMHNVTFSLQVDAPSFGASGFVSSGTALPLGLVSLAAVSLGVDLRPSEEGATSLRFAPGLMALTGQSGTALRPFVALSFSLTSVKGPTDPSDPDPDPAPQPAPVPAPQPDPQPGAPVPPAPTSPSIEEVP